MLLVIITFLSPIFPREPKEKKPQVYLPARKSLRLQRVDPSGVPLPPEPEPQILEPEHVRGVLNFLKKSKKKGKRANGVKKIQKENVIVKKKWNSFESEHVS